MKATHTDIRTMLGAKAALFNQNGINFLKCRYNGTDHELTTKLIKEITNDTLEVDPSSISKLKEFFGYEPTPASIAIFLLGRMPSKARNGDEWGSSSKSLTPEQETIANELAAAVNRGERYHNRRRAGVILPRPIKAKEVVPEKEVVTEKEVTVVTPPSPEKAHKKGKSTTRKEDQATA